MDLQAHFRDHFLFSFDVAEQPIYGVLTEIHVSVNDFFSWGGGGLFVCFVAGPDPEPVDNHLAATGDTVLKPQRVWTLPCYGRTLDFVVFVQAQHVET